MLTNPPVPFDFCVADPISHLRDRWVNVRLAYCLNSVLNVKAVVAAFNQEPLSSRGLLCDYKPSDAIRMQLFEAPEDTDAGHGVQKCSGAVLVQDQECK